MFVLFVEYVSLTDPAGTPIITCGDICPEVEISAAARIDFVLTGATVRMQS